MVLDAEMLVADDVLVAMFDKYRDKYDIELPDDGNEIFLTNKLTDMCFTITVKQDERKEQHGYSENAKANRRG